MKRKSNLLDKDILLQIIKEIAGLKSPGDVDVARIISKHPKSSGRTFSKSEIIEGYQVLKKELKLSPAVEKIFLLSIRMKKVRTLSGVTPVTVLTKPYPCPGNCVYCPNDPKMPKSYLSSEPGAQRAASNKFDPYLQVYNRLVAYKSIGHPTDKVELIVLGGTWSYYPEKYQIWFIKRCFDAMNDFDPVKASYISKVSVEKTCAWEDLFKTQKINESAKTRCVGLVLETRPDYVTEFEVIRLRKLGATKMQMGVQSLDDAVLKLNKRGHDVETTARAFSLLRSAGFKIHAHWMPNLLGSNSKADVKDFKKLFSDKRFKPDELKIYPCSLIAGTKLVDFYKKGKWIPYSEEDLLYVLKNCLLLTPRYCRITRMIRDISSKDILVGNKKSNFRQIVEQDFEKKGNKINEIRYREIKNEKIIAKDLELKITTYETTTSSEYFMEYVTKKDKITGFLRLSLPKVKPFIKELENCAIIREIHVYGQALGLGVEKKGEAQHMGLGKKLIEEAKNIAKNKNYAKLAVISSVGTREYYRNNNFKFGELYQYLPLD